MNLEEVKATVSAANELEAVTWATPLLKRTRKIVKRLSDGLIDHEKYLLNPLSDSDKAILIEIRFAHALHKSGIKARYEYQAGVGGSSIDFLTDGNPPWMIEVMSLRESQAIKDASWKNGAFFGRVLSSDAEDSLQSVEGEIIKAQERISAKVYDNNRNSPIKFPLPNGHFSMILVDARGFIGEGGDCWDWHHITHGAAGLPSHLVLTWPLNTANSGPIQGLFEDGNPRPASITLRERIHFIGFVCEKYFMPNEISESISFFTNLHLFASPEEAKNAQASFPLK